MNKFFYSPTKKQSLLCIAIVLFLIVCVFSPMFQADFLHWKDYSQIVDNVQVRSLSTPNIKSIFKSGNGNIYAPLTTLSWAVEYRFFKHTPFVYHLNNLLLHLGVVLFIYLIARRIGLSVLAASFAGLLFGIHPLHVESVAWASERSNVLYAFLYMFALYVYMFHLEQYLPSRVQKPIKVNRYIILVTLLGTLSILTTPMAISLPLILWLFDWFKGRKIGVRTLVEKIPLVLLMLGVVWISYAAHTVNPIENIVQASLIWTWTFIFYIKQFIWPLVLLPIYRLPLPVELTNPEYIFSCSVFVVLFGAFIIFRRYKWFVFAILFYVFSIFFLLRFDDSNNVAVVADRFMYLPSLGICLLLGYAFDRLINRGRAARKVFFRALPAVCCVVLFSSFGFLAYQQTQIWHDDETFWQYQLENNPEESVALTNLASALMKNPEYADAIKRYKEIRELKVAPDEIKNVQGVNDVFKRVDWIESLFKRSVHLNPKQADGHYNLAYFYEQVGADKRALFHYLMSASMVSQYLDLYVRIGDLHVRMYQPQKAVAAYDKALLSYEKDESMYMRVLMSYRNILLKDPTNAVFKKALRDTLERYVNVINKTGASEASYFNLGYVYESLGNLPAALLSYKMVVEKNPENIDAYYRSGLMLRRAGKYPQAVDMYDKALNIDNRRVDVLLEKANTLVQMTNADEAIEIYKKVLSIDKRNTDAYFNLGYTYENMGRIQDAKNAYEHAVDLGARKSDVYYNLGNIYAQLRIFDKAEAMYLKTVEIDVNHQNAWVNLTLLAFQLKNIDKAYTYYKEAQLLGYAPPHGLIKAFEEAGLLGEL